MVIFQMIYIASVSVFVSACFNFLFACVCSATSFWAVE
jgi:hypothetical protein